MHDDDPPPVNDEDTAFDVEQGEVRARVQLMKQQHADLDASIVALEMALLPDQLQLARLKKQKLLLRDQIVKLEDRLTPDIIA